MSKTLPGEHYCEKHQGNRSHYAVDNCSVCKLAARLAEAVVLLRKAEGHIAAYSNTRDEVRAFLRTADSAEPRESA